MAGSYNLGTAEGVIRIKYDGAGAKKAQDDFAKTEASATKSGATLHSVSTKSAIAAGLLAAGIAYVADKAIDFEKEISAIGAVSGAQGPALDSLRKKALQLGADTQFSASQAAVAMEELAKSGVAVPDILNGAADAAVNLAAAGGIDLPQAADIASNAMNTFNLKASDLNGVVNDLAGAANASSVDVSDLGQALTQVGAIANLMGLSVHDTTTALAELGNAGIKGSDAGTSLKSMLMNLQPQTKAAADEMKNLGIITKDGANQFFDAQGHLKSYGDISQVLQNSLKGMTDAQKEAALQTLFGSDGIRAAAVAAKNGATGFDTLAAAMSKTSAADVAKARMGNTAGQIEQLKGSVETAAIAFGELLLPALTSVAKSLTSFANWLNGLSGAWKETILIVLAAGAGLLVLVAVIAKVIAVVGVVKDVIAGFKIAWLALNASFIATPIGAIITAIVILIAAIFLLWTHSAGFRNFWIAVWGGIWSFMKAVGAWFAGPFANFFIAAFGVIMTVFNAVKGPVMAVFNFIKDGIVGAFNVVNGILTFFAPLFQAVFGLIVSIVKLAWSIITAVFQVAFAIITPIVQLGMLLIQGAIQAALWVIMGIWNFVWNALRSIIILVWGWIGPYVMGAITVITTIIQTALAIINGIWQGTWMVIRAIVQSVWGVIVGIVRAAVGIVVGIIDGIKVIVDRVRGFFNQLRDAAKGGVDGLITFVAGIAGRVLGAIGNFGSLLYSAGQDLLRGLINGISSFVSNVVGAVKNAVQSAIDGAKSLLGIKSPSTVMMKIGEQTGLGFLVGLAHQQAAIQATAYGTFSAPESSTRASTSNTNNNFGGITVNVPSAVTDPEDIAAYTAKKILRAIP